jgi:hypothetical protein
MLGTLFGRPMAQERSAIGMWEEVLASTTFERIVELGAGRGNWSLFLALWCRERGAEFRTFDIANRVVPGPLHKMLSLEVKALDIFANEIGIGRLISKAGRTVLFCDNGHKPSEVVAFARPVKKFLKRLHTKIEDGKTRFFTRTGAVDQTKEAA